MHRLRWWVLLIGGNVVSVLELRSRPIVFERDGHIMRDMRQRAVQRGVIVFVQSLRRRVLRCRHGIGELHRLRNW